VFNKQKTFILLAVISAFITGCQNKNALIPPQAEITVNVPGSVSNTPQKSIAVCSKPTDINLGFSVEPYLMFASPDGIRIGFETKVPSTAAVHYGTTSECKRRLVVNKTKKLHNIRLTGLKSGTQYFYKVVVKDSNSYCSSNVKTFQTALTSGSPIAFAVFGDTQGEGVSDKLAKIAQQKRPNFVIHTGDLVYNGKRTDLWRDNFFREMKSLLSSVPIYPAIGNHEKNAKNYYDFFDLPQPEYYYDFTYGDAHFIVVDALHGVKPGSKQYMFVEEKLKKSKSKWKFVYQHHPPYTSDSNDYGNLFKTNKAAFGDKRSKPLTTLFDKYSLDINFAGHIHYYERTWPFKAGKTNPDGTVYIINGGGGGRLEVTAPVRAAFANQLMRTHHFLMVYINGDVLELKAFDIEGKLFDSFVINKRHSKQKRR
jgi:predicted phosphodiesterase